MAGFLLLVQLAVLYLCGSYASSRALGMLSGPSGSAGGPELRWRVRRWVGRGLFYALVMPGVVLHESAHYVACLVTRTRVARFEPFSPTADSEGRIILGYVAHEKRPAPIMAVIGLAPMILNPAGILAVTAVLTPLSPTAFTAPPQAALGALWESGFLTASPLTAIVWVYLMISFAVGSVPSREDLRSVPAVLLLAGAGTAVLVLHWGTGCTEQMGLASSAGFAARHAIGLYTLPVLVAICVAGATALIRRISKPA